MFIKQLYTGCLSEAAYYIESNGEAAIIDPIRDIDPYLELANKRKARIKYIFETHFHADFISGHMDLSDATGAPIIYGPQTQTKLPVHIARDGEKFQLGILTIEVLHTPGHTLESACYLLKDKNGKDHCVFTGDTLFVGDVGRPDLAQKENEITVNDLAGMMYDSLHAKLFPLPDDVIVYPAHGPGSACGKNLGPDTQSTIGMEKQTNYALKADTKEEFIRVVTEGIPRPPQYFPINAMINKQGYESLNEILKQGLEALPVDEFKKRINEDIIVLDTRSGETFTSGFVPGSINIGLEGRFAEWAGSLLPFDRTILLITEPGKEKESIIRLARVGFNKMSGYLKGGFDSWKNAGEKTDMIIDVESDELIMDIPYDKNLVVLDVRKPAEYADGHLKNAVNIPLDELTDPGNLSDIEDSNNLYIHCAAGYRSVIAASLLKRQGIHNLRNVSGGWDKIQTLQNVEIIKEAAVLN
ncbi:MAG: MBL fold metallo-hydrolase [Chitinophagaceae bacterium]|jgi:glyoxylase-like metal-dependent hydrolase (beta-lactamase superfamily II)/rhodanese-related sulfurtransferase|nr:MBL fold metallo-hydrolase [Chitinophagaceae bacterium]OQY95666.1 MAG: MBL fold metallo-hydrolase [Sphingobacteriales bacterium UTBCD1]